MDNAVRNKIFDFASSASLAPKKEPKGVTQGKERPADVLIPDFAHGKNLVIDVAVVDPLQDNYAQKVVSGESAAGLYAANVKDKRYKAEVEKAGNIFMPMVVETSGAWSEGAHQTLDTIAKKWAQRLETSVIKVRAGMHQRLSSVLQRSCAAMILSRTPRPWSSIENF